MDEKDVKDLIDRFDVRYVKRSECEDNRVHIQSSLHSDDKRLAVIETQQKINNWLTLAIAAGIVSLVIKVFLGS